MYHGHSKTSISPGVGHQLTPTHFNQEKEMTLFIILPLKVKPAVLNHYQFLICIK